MKQLHECVPPAARGAISGVGDRMRTDESPDQMTNPTGAVQSVNRALALLQRIADAGGSAGISELSSDSGLPLSTVHRLLTSLTSSGYVRQEPRGQYTLGANLVALGDAASRRLGSWVLPWLEALVQATGETANAATLDGDTVVYVAQVPSPHSMRTSPEVGTKVLPHCTGVGKALLSQLSAHEAIAVLGRTGMPAMTPNTVTNKDELLMDLARISDRGYAVDDEEEQLGARCLAVPLAGSPVRLAISVSGPLSRLPNDRLSALATELLQVKADLISRTRFPDLHAAH